MSIKKGLSSLTPPPPPPPPPSPSLSLSVHDLEDLLDWQQQLSLEDIILEPFFLPLNQRIVAVLQSVDGPPFINKIIIKLFSKQFVIQKISKKQLNFIQSFYFKQN
jgi:hypothetical protein